jgi:hypothetical protein
MKTLAFNGCRGWCAGSSKSEGGFEDGRYAAGSLLDFNESKDTKGKKYYKYRLLVRSADGNEGGRHYLVSSTVGSDGQLYICKVGYTHVEVEATTLCCRLNSFLLRVCTACMHASGIDVLKYTYHALQFPFNLGFYHLHSDARTF